MKHRLNLPGFDSDVCWTIDKTLELCYGHRVWTQVLDDRFSNDLKCACRHLHGHEAKIQVYLSGSELNPQGMLTDFRHLEWAKKLFNSLIDHQFIMHKEDPLLPIILDTTKPGSYKPEPQFLDQVPLGSWTTASKMFLGTRVLYNGTNNAVNELFDGLLVVDFVPTSENLAKWVHSIVNFRMYSLQVACTRVDWWETPKSRSSHVNTESIAWNSEPTFTL